MLDFGTDLDQRADAAPEDDLFAGNVSVSAPDAPEAEPVAEIAEDSQVKTIPIPPVFAAPPENKRKMPVKPPVLPKYSEPPAPPVNKIMPALRNNPHFLHRKRKAEEFSAEDKMEVSRILKAARKNSGLSVEDVENATQIRAHYIVALEEADYDRLPRPVYVLAYLRKLCALYDIPEDEENLLVRPWRNIPCELPENLPASVQKDDDSSNPKVLHQIEVAVLAIGGLIILGIIALITVLIVSYFSGKDVPEPIFDTTKLLELQDKPQLKVPKR